MRKSSISFLFIFLGYFSAPAQNNTNLPERLKIFMDCHVHCDMTFIRTEINLVDFLLDRQAADVHVLITGQDTGGGGNEYQLIFFGQNQFKNITDTLYFSTDANITAFEKRDVLIKYLKLGLSPYIARTKMAKEVQITMKSEKPVIEGNKTQTLVTKDPWNYWVLQAGINGSYNIDEVYKESEYRGELSAKRVTEETKIGFELQGGKNKSEFNYEDSLGNVTRYTNKNNNYEFGHYLVKSINNHWSWGYEASASRSTFSNNKFRALFRTAFEYNIFPYKLVNTKSFKIIYVVDVRRNNYIDTTLYEKTKETLLGNGIEAKLNVNQKWGTLSFGTEYHTFLHNWSFFKLEVNAELDIRITGGLSFRIYSSAELTRDQLYLPKAGATPQEVFTRRRQLASGYSFRTNFGLSYRFGSKLNNFVNPRFD